MKGGSSILAHHGTFKQVLRKVYPNLVFDKWDTGRLSLSGAGGEGDWFLYILIYLKPKNVRKHPNISGKKYPIVGLSLIPSLSKWGSILLWGIIGILLTWQHSERRRQVFLYCCL